MKASSADKDDDLDYRIYFSSAVASLSAIDYPAIIFSPINDDWNDFKYRCRYEYRIIFRENPRIIEGKVFLGFVADDNRIENDGRISSEIDIIAAHKLPDFFTLQGGMEDYRYFVSEHGVKGANNMLLALNDLVASKRAVKRSKLVEAAMRTGVFNLAFMRDAERFFAFHNADTLLDGLGGESFSRISTKLSLSYEVAGFSGDHNLNLDFDAASILPKRIGVLIGRNGLGKSQALRAIVKSLVNGDQRFKDRERGRPMISRLLAIATPGETGNTFPAERANKRIRYRRLTLNRSARTKASRGFCDLCVQLVRSNEFIGDKDRWGLFEESLGFFSDFGNIVIPLSKDVSVAASHVVRINSKNYVPLLQLNRGGEQARLEVQGAIVSNANPMVKIGDNVLPLSSGQLAFIKFVVQACLFVENGTLVLLDEPETHLHPNFISRFVKVLDRLLKLTGSIALIATHSAYFVREVPRTQVSVFKDVKAGQVSIINPRLKTFGADVGAISYFVFEDEITNALIDEILENLLKNPEGIEALMSELKTELSADVVMLLRRKLNLEAADEED